MPSASNPAAVAADPEALRLRSALESGVRFHIKAGGAKWSCTLLDRATHERMKAVRSTSSSSVSTTSSSTLSL
ncbi:hypothetical protein B0T17DRAFT_615624 [Bombardia bombarda]|uniref:Uncharacterized protein n=1 Tax=Bombardia bombarda TaxID=252184 RepID=A0AA40C9W1_9PEZI|nr:hypothetical protein B0T17DRAFT_615624 [Bombardia bombarda]